MSTKHNRSSAFTGILPGVSFDSSIKTRTLQTVPSKSLKFSPHARLRTHKNSAGLPFRSKGPSQSPEFTKIYENKLEKHLHMGNKKIFDDKVQKKVMKRVRDSLAVGGSVTLNPLDNPRMTKSFDYRYNTDLPVKNYCKKSPLSVVRREVLKKNYELALDLIENLECEADNSEGLYLKGFCYLNMKMFENAQKCLEMCKFLNETYSPDLYLALAKCYYHQQDFFKALSMLALCLKHFPHYEKAYMLRAKLYLFNKDYDKSIKDLSKFKNAQSFLLLSNCWKRKKYYDRAVKYLKKYKKTPNYNEKTLIKEQGKLDYSFGKTFEARNKFETLIKADKNDWEACYYLCKCIISEKDLNEAELLLENVAQFCENPAISSRALFRISRIKEEKFDFFGAFGTLNRLKQETRSPKKQLYIKYLEAMVTLVHTNYEDAIKQFSSLINLDKPNDKTYKCIVYRAFCYFSIKKYTSALEDYDKAQKIEVLDKASQFNYEICVIMCEVELENYASALLLLDSEYFNEFSNPMWKMLRVLCLVLKEREDKYDVSEACEEFKKFKCDKDNEIYVFEALFLYSQKDYDRCVKKINKSLGETEDPSFLAYALRGFSHCTMKCYYEAYQDFKIALKINKSLKSLYPYSGLCAYYAENSEKASKLISKISSLDDSNAPLLSIYLLLVCEKCEDALSFLEKLPEVTEFNLLRAHSYLLQEKYDECLDMLEKIDESDPKNDLVIIINLLNGLNENQGPGLIFNEKYYLWLLGLEKFYSKDFLSAINLFEQVLEIINYSQLELIFTENKTIRNERLKILYNIALCCMLQGSKSSENRAKDIFNTILESPEFFDCGEIYLLFSIVDLSSSEIERFESSLEKVSELARDVYVKFIENAEVNILPFGSGCELEQNFKMVALNECQNVKVRPTFSIPRLQPPLDFNDSFDILMDLLKFEGILIRPEVPWLNKVNDQYVFTDNLIEDIESQKSGSVSARTFKESNKSLKL